MRVRVLFFGQLKDLVGRSSEELELPQDARLETLFDRYASQFPKLRAMADSIAVARNQEFATLDAPLAEGDEVALMPPVSGGSDADDYLARAEDDNGFYAITERPIDVRGLVARTQGDDDGAVLIFEGVTRNHSKGRQTRHLDYECYVPLALKQMQAIGRQALERHDVHRVSVVHRLGRLEIQEASVAIVVASAHRKSAYEANLEIINTLKTRVPIWKKETFVDGEVWVEGDWDDSVVRASPIEAS